MKCFGVIVGAALALTSLTAQAADTPVAEKPGSGKPAAGSSTAGTSSERWYYLGSGDDSKSYIDRQQRVQRDGDTATLWVRTTLDYVPADLKVHPKTKHMDVQSRYDCRKHTVAHLKSHEISADSVYLGGETKPLDPVPVNPGTRDAAVMSAVCSAS